MRRKIIALLLCICISGIIAGCGSDDKTSGTDATNENNSGQAQESETNETQEPEEETKTERSLDDLAAYLKDQGIITGEATETSAEMIGAIEGVKYADNNIELYQYDTSSEAYKTLEAGEELGIEGLEGYAVKAAAVNEEFVLILSNDGENADAVNAFTSYK